jgi:hypothetical protein
MEEYGFECIDNYINDLNAVLAADATFGDRGYGLSVWRDK